MINPAVKGIPKVVRIGCYNYSVNLMHDDDAAIAGVMGAAYHSQLSIRLRTDVPPQQLANTFLHEVIHAIHYVFGIGDDDNEETFTNLTTNGLCAFWMDNPKAMEWFQKTLFTK